MKTVHATAITLLFALTGCATLTEDAFAPTAFSFSDGSNGQCSLYNKRGNWTAYLPGTAMIRKSDDQLRYECTTQDGRRATGGIPSEMGSKIIASAVFIDFGITDAITDKHRRYPASFVIPIPRAENGVAFAQTSAIQAPAASSSTIGAMSNSQPAQYLCKDEKGESYLSVTNNPAPGCIVR